MWRTMNARAAESTTNPVPWYDDDDESLSVNRASVRFFGEWNPTSAITAGARRRR